MARQWRIEYEGALYHVVSRGNERRQIVQEDKDRADFIKTLGSMCERFDIELYAYVLMDSHYHLLLKTLRANLSKSMQWFGGTYTRRYHMRHGHGGHLFQGRLKSFVVENDSYLLQLSYYIHRNPLRAGMVERLADYRWSSYGAYAYNRNKMAWLKTEELLSMFDGKEKKRAYRQACQAYAREERKIWEDFKHGLVMGSDQFVDEIKNRFLPNGKATSALPQQRQVLKSRDLSELARSVARAVNIKFDELIHSQRIPAKKRQVRDLILHVLRETGLYTNEEIGGVVGLTHSAISRQARKIQSEIQHNKELKRQYDRLKSKIKL